MAGAASGLMLWLAFPPVDQGWFGFFALIPLAILFRRRGPKELALAGAAFSLVFFSILLTWLILFGIPAHIGLVVLQAAFFIAGFGLGGLSRKWLPEGLHFLVFPVTYLVVEFMRGWVPWGGFTWGGLGYSQHDNLVLLRFASLAGVWGITFIVALVNSLLAETWILRRKGWRVVVALLGFSFALALMPAAVPVDEPDGESIRVALVQGSIPGDAATPKADDLQVLENHARLTKALARGEASLVVWPESSVDTDPREIPAYNQIIQESIAAADAPLLVGTAIDAGEKGFKNVSMLFDSDGEVVETYQKVHLVPFGEYVPGRSFLEPFIPQLERVPRDALPGDERVVFDLPEGKFADVICFESAFPGLVREFIQEGARLLIVSTNNASFERTAASEQHLAFAQLRAAEHRVWVGQAGLTGISAVVSPNGKVEEKTELYEQALLVPELAFATGLTVYGRVGDWLPHTAITAWLVMVVLGLATTWSQRGGE